MSLKSTTYKCHICHRIIYHFLLWSNLASKKLQGKQTFFPIAIGGGDVSPGDFDKASPCLAKKEHDQNVKPENNPSPQRRTLHPCAVLRAEVCVLRVLLAGGRAGRGSRGGVVAGNREGGERGSGGVCADDGVHRRGDADGVAGGGVRTDAGSRCGELGGGRDT